MDKLILNNSSEIENSQENSQENINKPFDTLVLSGGSINAIIILGSLQYLEDNDMIQNINTYVGTSAGAICSYVLSIGYTPIEIMVLLCTKQILEKLKNFNILDMINGLGATSFSHIQEQLEKMTIDKIGKLLTLKELYTLYGKKIYCITHNITTDSIEVISYENHPNLSCITALKMSANLPFVFEHFEYKDNYYIDGGISNNFPIDIGEEKGDKVLGITILNTTRSFSKNKNILNYIYHIMAIPIKQQVLVKINNALKKSTVITLVPSKSEFFNFDLDTRHKLEMFSDGFKQMLNFFHS
jgi:NTE family protein